MPQAGSKRQQQQNEHALGRIRGRHAFGWSSIGLAFERSGARSSRCPVDGLPVGRSQHTASPALKPFARSGAWDLGRCARRWFGRSSTSRRARERQHGRLRFCARPRGRSTRWVHHFGGIQRAVEPGGPRSRQPAPNDLRDFLPGERRLPLPKRNPKGCGCSARCSAQTGSVAVGSARGAADGLQHGRPGPRWMESPGLHPLVAERPSTAALT